MSEEATFVVADFENRPRFPGGWVMSVGLDSAAGAAAENGRSAFVDFVLRDFSARTGIVVSKHVRAFILRDVLKPDEDWFKGLRKEAFNPDEIGSILAMALDRAASARVDESGELDIAAVGTDTEGAFYQVIHVEGNCIFPLWFC